MSVIEILQAILRKTGQSQSELADDLGVSQAAVSRWLDGADPRGENRDRIYERARELMIAVNVPTAALGGSARPVPLISWVSAGHLASPEDPVDADGSPSIYAPGLDPNGDWIALRVDGASMDRISPPNSIIFVNRRDQSLVPNACYVIADESGEATYKRYRPGPDRFEPVSTLEHQTLFPSPGNLPRIIGRVRLSMIEM